MSVETWEYNDCRPSLHVVTDGDYAAVQLDSRTIGSGSNRQEAVTRAVRYLEWAIDALQTTPVHVVLCEAWGQRAAAYLSKAGRPAVDDLAAYECAIMAAHVSGLTGPEPTEGGDHGAHR